VAQAPIDLGGDLRRGASRGIDLPDSSMESQCFEEDEVCRLRHDIRCAILGRSATRLTQSAPQVEGVAAKYDHIAQGEEVSEMTHEQIGR
jgi:hypothetical protein